MTSKRHIIWAAAAFALISGMFLDPRGAFGHLNLVLMLISLLFLLAWLRVDSDARFYKRSRLFNVACVAATFLALPYYFFRTRGFKGGSIATLIFYLYLIGYSLLEGIGLFLRSVLHAG